jgi:large subunit ribosomal protein L32
MAVPKKKTSKSRSRRRHSAYLKEQVRRLKKRLSLGTCADCGAAKLNHHVCKECGKYNGKQILDKSKEIDKITTIKA